MLHYCENRKGCMNREMCPHAEYHSRTSDCNDSGCSRMQCRKMEIHEFTRRLSSEDVLWVLQGCIDELTRRNK